MRAVDMRSKAGERSVAIGVDVGGTWVRATVVAEGRRPRRYRVAVRRVPELSNFLLTLSPERPPAAIVVASRGVWTPRERSAVARRLRRVARRVAVISDAEAAFLGAVGDGAGILILAGTGSIVLGRDAEGQWARAGGLGPLVGDEGSGFWVGREWLRALARSGKDGDARRLAPAPDAARRIAALAPRVLRLAQGGHARARQISRDGARHLAALAALVARRLALPVPVRVSWAGSVMDDARYRRGVARALAAAGVDARWVTPREPPVDAAAHLAARLAASSRAASSRAAQGGAVRQTTASQGPRRVRARRPRRGRAQRQRAQAAAAPRHARTGRA
jgi:N-acetylglucosamine kinase-like BadF-type ATPase